MGRLLLLFVCTLLALPGRGQVPWVMDHVRILDEGRLLENQRVTVRQGLLEVTPATPGPPSGLTLVPGFIDTHVHLALVDPARVVAAGVTTVRDLGWDPAAILDLKARLRGRLDMVVAGPMLCAPGGYPSRAGWCPAAAAARLDSPEAARAQVQRLAGLGVGVIKVALEPRAGPTLPLSVLRAVVQEAHRLKLRVVAHVATVPELEKCLEAGVDELAHFLFDDSPVSDAMIARMVRAGMVVCPTLHVNPSPVRLDNLARFVAHGGRVIYGTDMGNAGPPPGIDLTELQLMHKAGMSWAQVMSSATSQASGQLGLSDRGRIASGLRADILVVEGDPLTDPGCLGHLRQVLVGGVAVER